MRDESLDIAGEGGENQLQLSSDLRPVAGSSDPMFSDKFADHPLRTGAYAALLTVVLIIHILMMAGGAGIASFIDIQS